MVQRKPCLFLNSEKKMKKRGLKTYVLTFFTYYSDPKDKMIDHYAGFILIRS